jgi:uncharacterized membrane protein
MIRLAVLLLGLTASAVGAEVYPAFHAVVGVAEDDVLNIRTAPDAGADIIGTLAPNAMGVEVIGVTEGWALVNTGEGSGYASMQFLAREEGPDWYALEQPLACFGTEPFWSLAIDPGAGVTDYSTPEPDEARQGTIGQTWPGAPWAPTAAFAMDEGMAVLRPAECSDGMSDRSFGIAIDVFLTQGDRQRLSGCCVLGAP